MSEFIKSGESIVLKPKGIDYDLINGKTYYLKYDEWLGQIYLQETVDISLPDKLYSTEAESLFMKRVVDHYNSTSNGTTGVLLEGEKGTGKTIMAKRIALETGLPIILIEDDISGRALNEFFNKFDSPAVIIFDEVEKNVRTERLLQFLDGTTSGCKKLVLMTCNDLYRVSEYMINRCSRVRYKRHFAMSDNLAYLPQVIADFDIKNKDLVTKFCTENISYPSIDNIKCFLTEVEALQDDFKLDEIISFLNIETKDQDNEKDGYEYPIL